MTQIALNGEGFVTDAELLAQAFSLPAGYVQDLMRIGEITSDCETSVDNDAGRMRLSSHYRDNAVRFVVDTTGTILEQTKFSAGMRTPKAK